MNSRLEMFSDGVFAIAITLLILEIKVPPIESVQSVNDVWRQLFHLWPSLFALIISFILIFVSWLGHHNLLKALDRASSPFLIANGFFLFTVIIIPFPTAFVAEYLNTPYAQPAIVFYSIIGLFHNVGWNVLYHYMLKPKPLVKSNIGTDAIRKYQQSARYAFLVYLAMAILSWWFPYVAITFNLLIWIYWLYLSATVNQDLGAE